MPAKKHPTRPFLKAWRERLNLTQEHLANALGTTHSTISRWESGTQGVDDKTFNEIARIMGILPEQLAADPADAERIAAFVRHVNRVRKLSKRQIEILDTVAEEIENKAGS